MKKVKMKFDMDQVKQFGIEHGEKFGLALAVLILGVFVVKAASRETLPENLRAKAITDNSARADEHIKASLKPPADQDVGHFDFVDELRKEPAKVPPTLADIRDIIAPPLLDPVKRVDPTLFKVEDIRTYAFDGGVPIVPGPNQANGVMPAPVAGPVAPPPGGLIPGRITGRSGRLGGARGTANPAPVVGLASGAVGGAPQGPQPFPAGFEQPGPQSTGDAKGVYGIVVTGLIPVQAQREEYERRFKNAQRGVMAEGEDNPGRPRGGSANVDMDSPKYVWCFLERTDTTDGKTVSLDFGDIRQVVSDYNEPNTELQAATRSEIKELHMGQAIQRKLEAEVKSWAIPGGEVVAPQFLAEAFFTWPLPPVLLHIWGAEAAHLPEIPLAAPVAPNGQPGVAPPAGPNGPAPLPDDFNAANGPAGGPGPGRRHPRGPRGVAPRPDVDAANGENVPYKLFRFVDLDPELQPGHVYKYRVSMLLRNPNFGLQPQVLLKPDATRLVTYRATPWSDASPAISIPESTRLLGGSIDRPRHQEPKAKIGVFTFDKVQAIKLIKEFDTEMGGLVGTGPDQTVKGVADPVMRQVRDVTGKFRTPAVVLDFRGNDEKLPGAVRTEASGGTVPVTDPAEILLLDNVDDLDHPRLIVVNEAKDKPIIDGWKQTHIPPAAPPAGNGLAPPAKGPAVPAKGNRPTPGGGLLPPRTGGSQTGRRGNR